MQWQMVKPVFILMYFFRNYLTSIFCVLLCVLTIYIPLFNFASLIRPLCNKLPSVEYIDTGSSVLISMSVTPESEENLNWRLQI